MRPHKTTERAIYREEQKQRALESPSLSQKFQHLKSLIVELVYHSSSGIANNGPIKFTVNPDHAKSVLRFDCANHECVRGDFDLSEALAQAIAGRRATAGGKIYCDGWLNKTVIGRIRCRNILRYKLRLQYGNVRSREVLELDPENPENHLNTPRLIV
jgi:hypothetical protein